MTYQLGKVKIQYLRDELEPGRHSAAAAVELSEELGQVGASHPLGGGHLLRARGEGGGGGAQEQDVVQLVLTPQPTTTGSGVKDSKQPSTNIHVHGQFHCFDQPQHAMIAMSSRCKRL